MAVIMVDSASDPEHADSAQVRLNARNYYTTHGIPCFDTGLQAFSVLGRVADYYRKREQRLKQSNDQGRKINYSSTRCEGLAPSLG